MPGFNGSDSSGAWWECTANWMQLQFLNSYPQAGGYIYNGMYYPAHGRDYYDSFTIWEAAREDARYGAAWVNNVWTNADCQPADQRIHHRPHDPLRHLRFRRQGRGGQGPVGRHGQEDGDLGFRAAALAGTRPTGRTMAATGSSISGAAPRW